MAQPRRWGWHQLDPSWADRLVADARLRPGATVLDVGAGAGAITRPLVAAGARVIAIEAHPQRASALRERFGEGSGVLVVRADARELRLPRHPYHVVANPPFSITAALMKLLLQPGSRMVSSHLVLQDKAARWWASEDAPGAARWWRTFEARLGPPVPRRAFYPSPPFDARVLVLRRR